MQNIARNSATNSRIFKTNSVCYGKLFAFEPSEVQVLILSDKTVLPQIGSKNLYKIKFFFQKISKKTRYTTNFSRYRTIDFSDQFLIFNLLKKVYV